MALRPLLTNTPRSPTGPNTPESIRSSEDVRRFLQDVYERTQWQICPNCQAEWNALTEAGICFGCIEHGEQGAKRQRELGEYIQKTLGPYGLERYSFDAFQVSDENEYAFRRFRDFKPESENLFLFGPCGTGKTHLAGALLKNVCAANLTVRWGTPIYFSRAMRSRFASEEDPYVEWLVAHEVLIIDDLGVGKDTDTTLKLLYEITDKRTHRKQNGLVLTSNLGLDELARNYRDDRIASRISGLCEVVQITGRDHRSRQ